MTDTEFKTLCSEIECKETGCSFPDCLDDESRKQYDIERSAHLKKSRDTAIAYAYLASKLYSESLPDSHYKMDAEEVTDSLNRWSNIL